MEVIERIPIDRLTALSSISYELYKDKCCGRCKNEAERKDNYKRTIQFSKHAIKAKGELTRLYSFTETTQNSVGGRLFSGGSIQGMARTIRGYLCEGITTDIDMINAHPSILEHICKKHNIHCPNLCYYNQNRDEIVSNFVNGKQLFLKAVNNDKLNKKVTHTTFVAFDKEMKSIQQQLCALPDYDYITKTVPTSKLYNWTGSAINRILCVYENEILQLMIHKVNKMGHEIFALMFDGFMIYGNQYSNDTLLRELEEVISEYGIRLSYKDHADELVLEDIDEDEEMNDVQATKQLMEDYPHFAYCKVLYCFDDDTGLWSADKNLHLKIIKKYARGKYATTLTFMEIVRRLLPLFCIQDDWYRVNQNSSLKKLLFKNGYYDGLTQTFHTEFNPSIVFFHKINYNYTTDIDMDYVRDIKQRCFINPLNEGCGNFLIENLARGLMGDRMKRILFGLGESGGGKSILCDMLHNVGGDYVGNFNGEQLCMNNSSADEASKMRWVLLSATKRLMLSNEIKTGVNLNGQMIKKISSGCDMLEGRTHGGEEQSFYCHFLPIVFANDMSKISPYDDAVDDRVRVVSYKKQFVRNPTTELHLQMDDGIKDEITTERFKQHMVWLFINSYNHLTNDEPDDVKNSKTEWIAETPNIVNALMTDYTFTNNVEDFVLSTELQEWLKDRDITITKLGREINKYLEVSKLNGGSNKKKIAGKTTAIWTGLKRL